MGSHDRAADLAAPLGNGRGPHALRLEKVRAGYGKRLVIDGISLDVRDGEVLALLGHNGAGKTTTLRVLAGLHQPEDGRILVHGNDGTGRSAAGMSALGVSLVPQGHGVFPSMSVRDNLYLGAVMTRAHGRRRGMDPDREAFVYELFPILKDRPLQRAGSLSGGQQQMVAIAMALMAEPKVLLLDEPSTGLAPVLVHEVLAATKKVNEELGTSVLVVEQNIKEVLAIADRLYVLQLGSIVFEGSPEGLYEHVDLSSLF